MAKDGRRWGEGFMESHCKDIKQDKVLELGPGPTQKFWSGKVETADVWMPADYEGFFEDVDISGEYDVFSSCWSIAYGYCPGLVIKKAISLLNDDGHLLIVTRTNEHKKEAWTDLKWMPTGLFLLELDAYFKDIDLVEYDETEDGEFFAGLWRVVR